MTTLYVLGGVVALVLLLYASGIVETISGIVETISGIVET